MNKIETIFCDILHIVFLYSVFTGKCGPCVLLNIPDGHQKEMPTAGSKHKQEGNVASSKQKQEGSAKEVGLNFIEIKIALQ